MDFAHRTIFTCRVSDNGLPNWQLYFSSDEIASKKPGRSFLAIASGETHVHDVRFRKSRHFLESSARYALLIIITKNLKTFLADKVPFCILINEINVFRRWSLKRDYVRNATPFRPLLIHGHVLFQRKIINVFLSCD